MNLKSDSEIKLKLNICGKYWGSCLQAGASINNWPQDSTGQTDPHLKGKFAKSSLNGKAGHLVMWGIRGKYLL